MMVLGRYPIVGYLGPLRAVCSSQGCPHDGCPPGSCIQPEIKATLASGIVIAVSD